jgi:hypothetical protein
MMRHEKLCNALRQLCEELSEQGRTISEIPTAQVVDVCRGVIPGATREEMMDALRVVGREHVEHADQLGKYARARGNTL